MKKSFSFAVWMTFASVVFKLLLYFLEVDLQKSITYVAFFNLLVISVGTFFGIRNFKILNPEIRSFKEDVKSGMRIAALYAALMSVFVYVYYNNIDSQAFETFINTRLENTQQAIDNGETIDIERVESVARFIFSPRTHATITLFGFLMAGTIYSLLISYFMRRMPGFK